MQVLVIGLGNFGFNVAKTLYENGVEVMVIDNNPENIQKIRDYCTSAVVADATNKEVLEQLNVSKADTAVVSLGDNIASATLATLYLKELGVKEIVAKAMNEDHKKILLKLGATRIINPEKDMAVKLAESLYRPNVLENLQISADYAIVEIAPLQEFNGKSLGELRLRNEYNVWAIAVRELIPERMVVMPGPEFIVKDSDILVLIGKHEDLNNISKKTKK
jgi:trk system potassium uptake protein